MSKPDANLLVWKSGSTKSGSNISSHFDYIVTLFIIQRINNVTMYVKADHKFSKLCIILVLK